VIKIRTALNLGCGNKYYTSSHEYITWINVDNWKGCSPDVLHDLNKFPYPFKSNSIDYIEMNGSLEHLKEWERCLKELWRICKKGKSTIYIEVPNFNYAWYHTYHKAAFNFQSIEVFHRYNSQEYFKVKKVYLKYTRSDNIFLKTVGYVFDFLANFAGTKSMFISDRIWGSWVGGFEALCFELEPLKYKAYDHKKYNKRIYMKREIQ
jgi:predicted SAM-dependent methyltransferase